jgi:hypothetical protein
MRSMCWTTRNDRALDFHGRFSRLSPVEPLFFFFFFTTSYRMSLWCYYEDITRTCVLTSVLPNRGVQILTNCSSSNICDAHMRPRKRERELYDKPSRENQCDSHTNGHNSVSFHCAHHTRSRPFRRRRSKIEFRRLRKAAPLPNGSGTKSINFTFIRPGRDDTHDGFI